MSTAKPRSPRDWREGRRLPPVPLRPENLFYRDMVRFADQLERYLTRFGRDRVHVIVHDDRGNPFERRSVRRDVRRPANR